MSSSGFQWAVETGKHHMSRLTLMPYTRRIFQLGRFQKGTSYPLNASFAGFTILLDNGELNGINDFVTIAVPG